MIYYAGRHSFSKIPPTIYACDKQQMHMTYYAFDRTADPVLVVRLIGLTEISFGQAPRYSSH